MTTSVQRSAIRRLEARGSVRVRGGDRVRFLEGMVSSEVAGLADGGVRYACQLDRKGHLLADLWLVVFGDEIWLDIAEGRGAIVFECLDKHVIADDVELENLGGERAALVFEGVSAGEVANAPELAPGRAALNGELLWFAAGHWRDTGLSLSGPANQVEAIARASGLPVLSETEAEVLRVEVGCPRFGAELGERTFPAEVGLDQSAVSFTKGCYIGQEIVARIHARGAVNRKLVQLRADSPMAIGQALSVGGRRVGEITSVVDSPRYGPLALGYVKPELGFGAYVDAGGQEVKIAELAPVA